MTIVFGARSQAAMTGLHPDLLKVLAHAAVIALDHGVPDFMVLEGVRTAKGMYAAYGQGRTAAECIAKGVPANYAQPGKPKVTWLNKPLMSNHRVMPDGFGHAFDAAPYPLDWKNINGFRALYTVIMIAAKDVGVKLRSGYDWDQDGVLGEHGETDLPHYELV